jgi:hypothetical protein
MPSKVLRLPAARTGAEAVGLRLLAHSRNCGRLNLICAVDVSGRPFGAALLHEKELLPDALGRRGDFLGPGDRWRISIAQFSCSIEPWRKILREALSACPAAWPLRPGPAMLAPCVAAAVSPPMSARSAQM